MDAQTPPSAAAARFEALIVPHRSLSPRGLRVLSAVLAALVALIGLRFWLLGAWPVLAIGGPEIALAVFLLHLNARRARASELVTLHDDHVSILRLSPSGQRHERSLPAPWLKVVLEEGRGRVPRLLLYNRATCEEIGSALGEDEKRDLAKTLQSVLHESRNPRFDNPQLRGDPR
jgi:uncharacterized membrane protein